MGLQENAEELASLLMKNVKEELRFDEEAALMFSGGLDSATLAVLARKYCNLKLYISGIENSHDLIWGCQSAELLDIPYSCIVYKKNDLYIGNIEISIINQSSRRGVVGIVIFNQSYWNKGFGTESIQILLKFAFETLNLNSVELEVFSNNKSAQRCYEKSGFKQMGVRREAVFMEGEYFDSLLLDITVNKWKSIKD